ncbi:MAG: coenzyme-B sulfoethylthiotransferase subunit alpha [Candidatus Methylarchaceae archaeon HK02M2]|nr:coenzyme-B sulfoethylthiotransferase subunit alpha [Candidatus Methylarchaceae archaeon HK02M2]
MSEKEKQFYRALRRKFKESPEEKYTTYYTLGGWAQDPRKKEYKEIADKIAEERGIPFYNPSFGCSGAGLGQRVIMPYLVSKTETYAMPEDIHFINNAAMHQCWDDIRRTIIVGLDAAHTILTKRLGREVTPETINHYLEVLNHALPGGAVIQEHMVEINPNLVSDCYVKIFTGDDELVDRLDKRFLININELFPPNQSEKLKKAIGKRIYQVLRMPTIVGHLCDGGTMSRWAAMQISMSMISSYRLMAGEAAVAEFAYAAKHAEVIPMATLTPWRRARGPNEPGGLPFGFLADMIQTDRIKPDDPAICGLETLAVGSIIYDQYWFGSYMSGGVGFTQYASAVYTDNILDDFVYATMDHVQKKYGGFARVKPSMEVIEDIATYATDYGLSQYELFPTLMETHFGGSQRASVLAAASGLGGAIATGVAQAGMGAWYLSMLLHKESLGRLGFYGYDAQDQSGPCNLWSWRSDEGLPIELRGPNYPNYAMNVGHIGEYTGIVASAHVARGDAWCANPLIKVAFADPSLKFDWIHPRQCLAKGVLKEYIPAGLRDSILPPIR